MNSKDFPDYFEAQALVQKNGIGDEKSYQEFAKGRHLPTTPAITYGEHWRGWGAFLYGTTFYDTKGKTFKFVIPGKPKTWSRPGVNWRKRLYDRDKAYKKRGRRLLEEAMEERDTHGLFDKQIWVDIHFYMPISSNIGLKTAKILDGKYHSIRPDVDNLTKLALDILNKTLIYDDSQICDLRARKIYSLKPRTEVFYGECDEPTDPEHKTSSDAQLPG